MLAVVLNNYIFRDLAQDEMQAIEGMVKMVTGKKLLSKLSHQTLELERCIQKGAFVDKRG